jgi:hypothetical protein
MVLQARRIPHIHWLALNRFEFTVIVPSSRRDSAVMIAWMMSACHAPAAERKELVFDDFGFFAVTQRGTACSYLVT